MDYGYLPMMTPLNGNYANVDSSLTTVPMANQGFPLDMTATHIMPANYEVPTIDSLTGISQQIPMDITPQMNPFSYDITMEQQLMTNTIIPQETNMFPQITQLPQPMIDQLIVPHVEDMNIQMTPMVPVSTIPHQMVPVPAPVTTMLPITQMTQQMVPASAPMTQMPIPQMAPVTQPMMVPQMAPMVQVPQQMMPVPQPITVPQMQMQPMLVNSSSNQMMIPIQPGMTRQLSNPLMQPVMMRSPMMQPMVPKRNTMGQMRNSLARNNSAPNYAPVVTRGRPSGLPTKGRPLN